MTIKNDKFVPNHLDKPVTEDQQHVQPEQNWLTRHWQKVVALLLWAIVVISYLLYMRADQLGPLAAIRALVTVLQDNAFSPLLYILIYMVRPLIFFSATLLTLLGGFLFGPVWGIVYVVIGSNLSAMVAYLVGRYFGQGQIDQAEASSGIVQRYAERMRKNSFETVLTMRFVFLPYDLVNYLGGLLRIEWKAFLLATALGSIPGTISFVLFGASIEGNFDGGLPRLDPWTLVISVGVFAISLLLSRYFKRREGQSHQV